MHLHKSASVAVLCAVIFFVCMRAEAQEPEGAAQPSAAAATITVNAKLVNLPVVVRDKKGALIQNLTKADFALRVDGKPETIRYFDRDNDLPLTLGLLVDTSGSVRSALEEERTASEASLDEMMTAPSDRTPDQAFLIQFAHEAELLQDLTSSRPKMRAALDQVERVLRMNPGTIRTPMAAIPVMGGMAAMDGITAAEQCCTTRSFWPPTR